MRRKMLRTAGFLILSVVLSMVGCAGKGDEEPSTLDIQDVTLHDSDGIGSNSDPDSLDSNEIKNSGKAGSNNEAGNSANVKKNTESVYFEGADLNGRVLEFSNTGFTITPVYTEVYEDGTRSSWEAAPGKENEENNLYVAYTEDTVFEVVYFSMSMQEVSSREDADRNSIKKQTLVYVFGSSEDGKNWIADKVLIQKWD